MSRKLKITVMLIIVGIFMCAGQFATAGTTYSFGVVPQQKSSVLKKKWAPVIAYIAEKTGITLEFARTPSIPDFVKKINSGKFDFFYANPYSYVEAHTSAGYVAFANAKDKKIKGIVVVKKDSPFNTLEDLAGKKLSFPKGAFAADILLRAKFKQKGIDINANFTKTHDAGYVSVARGSMDACGGVGRTYKSQMKKLKDELKILWTSEGFTPHAMAAHPRVPAEDVKKVQAALIEMSNDPSLLKHFKAMKIKQGFQAAQDSDWSDVREIEPFLKSVSSD